MRWARDVLIVCCLCLAVSAHSAAAQDAAPLPGIETFGVTIPKREAELLDATATDWRDGLNEEASAAIRARRLCTTALPARVAQIRTAFETMQQTQTHYMHREMWQRLEDAIRGTRMPCMTSESFPQLRRRKCSWCHDIAHSAPTPTRSCVRQCTRRSRPGSRVIHASAMPRKVRAPQGTVPGNAWAARADGKCNRKIPPNAPAAAERLPDEGPAKCPRTAARRRQEAWQG